MKHLILMSLLFTVMSVAPLGSHAQAEEQPKVESALGSEPAEQRVGEQLLSGVAQQLEAEERQQETVVQLGDIQTSLELKVSERRNLRLQLSSADASAKEDLRNEIEKINADIDLLEKTFEQIAIGGIDLSVFGVGEGKFDWREELITVVKPLIENVKSLTEKPRKIGSLRRVISDNELAKQTSVKALTSIRQLQIEADSELVTQKLAALEGQWQSRLADLDREIQLAEFQLGSLEGKDVSWFEILKRSALDFASGRGLTVLFVIVSALAIWSLMRGILWLIRKRTSESSDRSLKVGYRLAAYGYRVLTGIFIAVAVMMVLYFRQDLLLLAIMVIIFIGAALALKNVLPKYIAEGRLLLNMGGVRETERVIYNGVPWEVNSINIHSRLVNPEIRGGIRLPISQMHDMISRPSAGDVWFPSSEGDWILADGTDPTFVVRQSVDMIELRDLNSVTRFMPSADYYAAGYPNLSRAKVFRISVAFGIDYATQKEDVEKIEKAFTEGIKEAFKGTPFEEFVMDVNTDFESAGDSSLNYLMLTKFKPEAAEFYNTIKRRIQRACVVVCSENEWSIPFPQLSVHLPESNPKPAE